MKRLHPLNVEAACLLILLRRSPQSARELAVEAQATVPAVYNTIRDLLQRRILLKPRRSLTGAQLYALSDRGRELALTTRDAALRLAR